MQHLHLGAGGRHADANFLLQFRQRLDGCARHQTVGLDLDLNRNIVGGPRCHRIFGRLPDAVPAAQLELGLALPAELLRELLEKVLAPHKPETNHSRAHIGGDHQLHLAVADAVAVGPAFVFHFFDFDGSVYRHGNSQEKSQDFHHAVFTCGIRAAAGGSAGKSVYGAD